MEQGILMNIAGSVSHPIWQCFPVISISHAFSEDRKRTAKENLPHSLRRLQKRLGFPCLGGYIRAFAGSTSSHAVLSEKSPRRSPRFRIAAAFPRMAKGIDCLPSLFNKSAAAKFREGLAEQLKVSPQWITVHLDRRRSYNAKEPLRVIFTHLCCLVIGIAVIVQRTLYSLLNFPTESSNASWRPSQRKIFRRSGLFSN